MTDKVEASKYPLFLVTTPHDGLVLMRMEDAARAIESGGARLYGLVQVDEDHMRPITRQEEFNINDRAGDMSGSK